MTELPRPRAVDAKCAFCQKEIVIGKTWCISFGNASVLGKAAVDQVCPECVQDAFDELDKWRATWAAIATRPHPFDCPGCPDCQRIKERYPPLDISSRKERKE